MNHFIMDAFLALVRTQSASRTAEELNVAQSTVSKRMKLLEEEIGAVLFDRRKGNKTFTLTSAGEALVDVAVVGPLFPRPDPPGHLSTDILVFLQSPAMGHRASFCSEQSPEDSPLHHIPVLRAASAPQYAIRSGTAIPGPALRPASPFWTAISDR
jgi:hypothetical protein